MLVGRFLMIVPVLAIAGSMVGKKVVPAGPRHVPDRTARSSSVLLVGVVVIVGALTFFPALSLGPIVEHFLASSRKGVLRWHSWPVHAHAASRCSIRRSSRRAVARQPAQARARGMWRRTRSCSWSRSAACSPRSSGCATCSPPGRSAAALVHRRGRGLALVHGALRELRRGGRRGPRQGPGRDAAPDAQGDDRAPARGRARGAGAAPRACARATWSWSRPAS